MLKASLLGSSWSFTKSFGDMVHESVLRFKWKNNNNSLENKNSDRSPEEINDTFIP